MKKFIGRKRELLLLKKLLVKKTASLAVIRGRRRIGKSRLATEFGRQAKNYIAVAGLAPTDHINAQEQRDHFASEIERQLHIARLPRDDWSDLFWHLANQIKSKNVVILLDEISWMGSKDPTFLAKLKNAWDSYFKQNDNLILILCGSVSSWIEKNIISSTAFFGRISLTLDLKELPLHECNEFWGKWSNQVSSYEKFKLLSVTGGVPLYLEHLDPHQTADATIKALCFIKEGILFSEFEHIFHDLFGRRSEIYTAIVNTLIQHPHAQLQDIYSALNINKSGLISEYLNDLIQAGFVAQEHTWHIKSGKQAKFSRYRIKDNYLRFYLKYILPNKQKILRGAYENTTIHQLPGWSSIMGLQFENLVLANRQQLYVLLDIHPADIIYDNPYFQRKTSKQAGVQIDYMIQTKHGNVYVCEIKFVTQIIGTEIITEVKEKIHKVKEKKYISYHPVLIHVNGVGDSVIESNFFAKVIDFSEFLERP